MKMMMPWPNPAAARAFCAAAFASATLAAAAATWSPADSTDSLTNELVVAAGETYTLTAEDAERLGSTCLHVTGEGTVVGTADFAAFTGSIRLSNGTYRHMAYGGLGSTNATHTGSLVIDGGTLDNRLYVSSDWVNHDITSVPVGLTVYLSGEGYQGEGAIRGGTQYFARTVVLTGDALITGGVQFRHCYLYNKGDPAAKLTVKDATLGLVCLWGGDGMAGGEVEVLGNGGFYLSDNIVPFTGSTIRFGDRAALSLFDFGGTKNTVTPTAPFGKDFSAALVFSGASWIQSVDKCPSLDTKGASLKDDKNRFAGAVTLEDGLHDIMFTKDEAGIAFDGAVGGEGGFRASTNSAAKAGWLRLSNAANTFAGGVGVRGTAQEDGTFLGGLSLLASGAAPVDGGAITLSNATLRLNNSVNGEQAYELPSIAVTDGGEILDNLAVKTNMTAKGLTKTGAGTLTLSSPIAFSELADVRGGTLRLAADPGALRGLKMWWRSVSALSASDVKTDDYYRGLDGDVSWAYRKWTNYGSGKEGDASYAQGYSYEGYIRIPGAENEDVTFNFISCLTRECKVTIDSTVVSHVNDNRNTLSGGVYVGNYTRLGIAPTFTMKAGWHKIAVFMKNSWNGTCGPIAANVSGAEVWPANFGIGVDWQGRCTTNTADYAKLQDPGDGSLLRWSHDETLTRPRFGGGVAFAAGTVFDLGGSSTALSVPSLAGTPTIRNGALKVASTAWSLRAGDVADGKPLTVESGSSLLFGEAGSVVTVSIAPGALRGLHGEDGKVKILAWAGAAERPANSFVASDALKEARWNVLTEDDGVYLERCGFTVIIR